MVTPKDLEVNSMEFPISPFPIFLIPLLPFSPFPMVKFHLLYPTSPIPNLEVGMEYYLINAVVIPFGGYIV